MATAYFSSHSLNMIKQKLLYFSSYEPSNESDFEMLDVKV